MNYSLETHYIRSDGEAMKLLVMLPKEQPVTGSPGVLWLHGGGYRSGMAELAIVTRAVDLVKNHGAVVIAPQYRLAGRSPYPAALKDCYRALIYMKKNTGRFGIRPDQLMVGGESAGGGLTAALCMYARDHGEVNIAFQMPLYPMLDCDDTDSSADNSTPVWNTKKNHKAWKMYLSSINGEIPYYASPAKCTDYSGLPPAYTFVGDMEPFYCETVDYIENLRAAGVEAEIDVYSDEFHAFDLFDISSPHRAEAIKTFNEHFEYAVKNYFAENTQ